MASICAIYGSPRRDGNTDRLLGAAVKGAREAGAKVNEIFLRDLKMSPCLEIYGCKKDGRCVIKDDFGQVRDQMKAATGIMIASPIFFYTVSAQVKVFMDRCQSLWVKKYWIDKTPFGRWEAKRRGLFISAGATSGKRLFDGALLSIDYFLDVLDAKLWKSLLYRSLDFKDDVLQFPQYLEEARATGAQFVEAINALPPPQLLSP